MPCCCVCLGRSDEWAWVRTGCEHAICESCAEIWLARRRACPICATPVPAYENALGALYAWRKRRKAVSAVARKAKCTQGQAEAALARSGGNASLAISDLTVE